MTCMSFYPRSATVRAETDCTMLEMLRNVLDVLQRNKTFRAQTGRDLPAPRSRTPPAQRASVRWAQRRNSSIICATASNWCAFSPGQVICRQGEPADSFYLVRLGFVKVSQTYPGGELVLAYLSRGDYFGEIGLLGGGRAHGDAARRWIT